VRPYALEIPQRDVDGAQDVLVGVVLRIHRQKSPVERVLPDQ